MGLLDFASKAVLEFKADTSDLKAKLKDLTEEEKKLQAQQVESAEQRNKGLDRWATGLGKVNDALEGLNKAVAFGKDVWNSYAENLRLTTAAGEANIERLSEAAHGLRSQTDLLTDAAIEQHGAYKLTQAQMETVERAMVALNRKGFESEKVHNAVLQSVVALKDDGLKDLGIFIDKAGLSMDSASDRAKLFTRILDSLAKAGAGVKDGQMTAAEGVKAAGVSIGDAWEKLKIGLGSLVTAFAPLLSALGAVAGAVGDIVSKATQHGGEFAGVDKARAYYRKNGTLVGFNGSTGLDYNGNVIPTQVPNADLSDGAGFNPNLGFNPFADLAQLYAKASYVAGNAADLGAFKFGKAKTRYEQGVERAKALAEERRQLANSVAKAVTDSLVDQLEAELNATNPVTGQSYESEVDAAFASKTGNGLQIDKASLDGAGLQKTLDNFYKKSGAFDNLVKSNKANSFLEKAFGPIDDFNAYKTAFDTLSGATGAAIGAWIDGSESAGKAFKRFIGEALKGVAVQMGMESLKHAAFALGSLAFYDYGGAAKHGAAAAAFAGGALIVGAASRALGGGGGGDTRASAGGGAASVAPSSAAASSQQTGGIVVITDSFADDTARMKQLRAQRLVGSVIGQNNAVVYA